MTKRRTKRYKKNFFYTKEGIAGGVHKQEIQLHEKILDTTNDEIPFCLKIVIKRILGKR